MKIVLLLTGELGVNILSFLSERKEEIEGVITLKDQDYFFNEKIKSICSQSSLNYIEVDKNEDISPILIKIEPEIVLSVYWPNILKKEVIDRITGTDFFATLPKFDSADQLITMVKEFTGGTFSINTSPLRGDHANSAKHKKVWIGNNIEQPDEIIVTGRKESYAKNKGTGTPNILIDDRPINIQKWQAAGGYGILYQANRDSLDKVKKGLEDYAKIRRDQ